MRSWTTLLALACLLQAGVIVALLAARDRDVAPPRTEPSAECLAILQRLERRLDERPHADASIAATEPAREPARSVRTPVDVADLAAQLAVLRQAKDTLATAATTYAAHDGAWLVPLGELAASHPEPDVGRLGAFASACDGPDEEAACRRWFFRPARDLLTTFGRPTAYQGPDLWRYDVTLPDGRAAYAGFRVVAGIVVHCEGSIRQRPN